MDGGVIDSINIVWGITFLNKAMWGCEYVLYSFIALQSIISRWILQLHNTWYGMGVHYASIDNLHKLDIRKKFP